MRILLNVDVGERPEEPEDLYLLADAVSVACGGHAGDAASMTRALTACAAHGTRAGAHPSYPDRARFGRSSMSISLDALERAIREQCCTLAAVARSTGTALAHAKLHGALYHDAARDHAIAEACGRGIVRALGPVTIVGPAHSEIERLARTIGCGFEREGFADRAMRPDGSLVPRSEPGAILASAERAAAQAEALVRSGEIDTICVHGDTPGAVSIARAVREALDREPGP